MRLTRSMTSRYAPGTPPGSLHRHRVEFQFPDVWAATGLWPGLTSRAASCLNSSVYRTRFN
jgi:hypothetical protein